MNERLINGATIVALACTVAATVSVLRQPRGAPYGRGPGSFGARTGTVIPDWKTYAQRGEWRGPARAKVILVEFADYQCPACRKLEGVLRAAQAAHAADLAVVFRNYPLTRIHPRAMEEANAAECAAAQGRFSDMHDLLFALQDSMTGLSVGDVARRAGIQRQAAFDTCVGQNLYQARIDEDRGEGRTLGVAGTPTLLINGVLVEGAPDSIALERYIENAIETHDR